MIHEHDLKCTNHVLITEGLDPKSPARKRLMWFVKAPYYFYHQIGCVDNPLWQQLSKDNRRFAYDPDWYKKSIKLVQIKTKEITQTITKQL